MRLVLNFSLFLLTFFILTDKTLSLTNYQIRKFCKRQKSESTCIKDLQDKRSKLMEGNLIEIPVIPYKK